jgi:nicotinamide/nicotinate riboside kinase
MSVKFIGLSGPSSSGKTTQAYLLKHIFPKVAYILHADDFCKEFDELPTVNGYLDAEGPDGTNFIRMAEVLDYMKQHNGIPPPDFKSWQDDVFPGQEEKALKTVPTSLLEDLRIEVQNSGFDVQSERLVFVDGFLLYQNPEIRKRLDLRSFFRLSHKVAKERRFTRPGYGFEAKPGEFWKTEDYFEKMVWRSHSEQHVFFFENGDVEGKVDNDASQKTGITVISGLNVPVDESVVWTTHQIISGIKS